VTFAEQFKEVAIIDDDNNVALNKQEKDV